jgi:hypothetical protein
MRLTMAASRTTFAPRMNYHNIADDKPDSAAKTTMPPSLTPSCEIFVEKVIQHRSPFDPKNFKFTMLYRPDETDTDETDSSKPTYLVPVALPDMYPTASMQTLEEVPDKIYSLSVHLSQKSVQWPLILMKIPDSSSNIYNPVNGEVIYTCGVPLPPYNRTCLLLPNLVLPRRRKAIFDAIIRKLPIHIEFLDAQLGLVLATGAAQTGVFDLDIRISNRLFMAVCTSCAAETGLKSRNVEKRINAV